MSRERGRQCQVEGCVRSSSVVVWFGDYDCEWHSGTDLESMMDDLEVCRPHAEQLGEVKVTPAVLGHEVTVDPEKAPGWRLLITVRPSGRWAVVLVEPGAPAPPESPWVER